MRELRTDRPAVVTPRIVPLANDDAAIESLARIVAAEAVRRLEGKAKNKGGEIQIRTSSLAPT